MSKAFITPPFTANFAHQLLEAKALGDGAAHFSVTLALPKDHPYWAKLKNQLKEALVEKFDKIPDKVKHWPIKDGDQVDWIPDGHNYVAFKRSENDGRPEVVGPDLQPIIDRSEIYSGMVCRASYRPGCWSNKFGKGVSIYLDNVQKLKDGEKIGRVTPAAVDTFEEYLDEGDDGTESTGGADASDPLA